MVNGTPLVDRCRLPAVLYCPDILYYLTGCDQLAMLLSFANFLVMLECSGQPPWRKPGFYIGASFLIDIGGIPWEGLLPHCHSLRTLFGLCGRFW